MDKLLIVGIESLSGSNLALALEDRFLLSGVSRDRSLQLEGIDVCVVRRDDLAGLEKHVATVKPRWILHCPLSAASSWDLDPAVSNVPDESAAATMLADWATNHDARFTVLSTDAVFAGPRMFHEEGSPPTASGVWPEAARRTESALIDKTALVVRSHVYGWSPQEDSFAEQVWSACTDRRPMAVDGRRHATPLLISDLAEFLERAYHAGLRGLWHVAGTERASPFRFACELAVALGLPAPQSAVALAGDAEVLDRAETSLCSRRARRALELSLPLLREGLQRFSAQAENGWRDDFAEKPGKQPPRRVGRREA